MLYSTAGADLDRPSATGRSATLRACLLNAIEQAIIATELDGTIQEWNHGAEALYGWSAAEVRGLNIVDVTAAGPSRAQAAAIMRALSRGHRWRGAFPVRHRDGSTFLALISDTPVFDEVGRLIGIVGISEAAPDGQVAPAQTTDAEASAPPLLTRRQLEVAVQIALGRSNTEIAAALVLTPGTVANHIAQIMQRLEVRSRTQVAVWVAKHDLLRGRDPGS